MFGDLADLYQETVVDHSRNPRNFRRADGANREAKGENPLCGDRFFVSLTIENGRVADAGFLGDGCAISKASASLMTELVRGRTEEEAKRMLGVVKDACTGKSEPAAGSLSEEDGTRIGAISGVRSFPARVKCATLAWHALGAALDGQGAATTEA